MTMWRALAGVILISAFMAAAWAGVNPREQRLEIPWGALDPVAQQQLRDVTERAIFSRETLGITVKGRQMVFDYLIERPDFAATAGRILGFVKYRVVKEREGLYWGDDAHGATGTFELVHAERGKRIYLAKGTFVKRFLPTIHGRIVLIMAYQHQTDQDGEDIVVNDVRGYLRIDNQILVILARIARPVVGPIVDRKVLRTFTAAGRLTEQASHDPAGLYRTLAASRQIGKAELQEFRKVLRCCAEASGKS